MRRLWPGLYGRACGLQDLIAFTMGMGDIYDFYRYDEHSAIADKADIVAKYTGASAVGSLDTAARAAIC